MRKLLLIFLFCLTAKFRALAYDVEINGIYYNLNSASRTATVTYQQIVLPTAYNGNVVIPEYITHNGVTYTVNEIGQWALRYCDLTSVVIPVTIERIGDEAFYGCQDLTTIYYNAANCSVDGYWGRPANLREVVFGEEVQSAPNGFLNSCGKLKVIRFNAKNCRGGSMLSALGGTHIDSMIIGDSVRYIPSNLCYEMDSLKYVRMGQSVRVIGEYAFRCCSRLTELELPPMLDSILTGGLQALRGIEDFYIPKSLRYVGTLGFTGISNKRIHIENLAAYSAITCEVNDAGPLYDNYLYVDGEQVTDLVLPDTTRTVGKYAFSGCKGLQTITLSDSLRNIEEGGFYHISGVQSVRLPAAVEKVGKKAFYDCDSLRTIISDAVNVPQLGAQCFYRWFEFNYTGFYSRYNVLLGCSVDSLAYAADNSWKAYKFRKERPRISVNATGGTVTGAGDYSCDEWVTLTAIADEGYSFIGWSDGDQTNPRYVQAENDATYEALFSNTLTGVESNSTRTTMTMDKFILNNRMYIRDPHGHLYTIDGVPVIDGN